MNNDLLLSVDVAKNKSTMSLFERGENYQPVCLIKPVDVKYDSDSISEFLERLKPYGFDQISCFMESTGPYHLNLENLLKELKFKRVIAVNPLYVFENKGDSLRRTKTDKQDCYKIACTYYAGAYSLPRPMTSKEEEAKSLSRYIEKRVFNLSSRKNEFRMYVGLAFPELEKIFSKSELFENKSLNLLMKYGCAENVAKASEKSIANALAGKSYRLKKYDELAKEIKAQALKSVASVKADSTISSIIIKNSAKDLKKMIEDIEGLKELLLSMVKEWDIFKVIRSFPGIGDDLALHLAAEIGNISAYSKVSKLQAAAGIDPKRDDSGEVQDKSMPISKRGNRHLRHWLFIAVLSINRQAGNGKGDTAISNFYAKKHSDENRHHYVATVACMSKLVRRIYYRYKEYKSSGELVVR